MHRDDFAFVLLKDFSFAYDHFDQKVVGLDARIEADIRTPMEALLASHVKGFHKFELDYLRRLATEEVDRKYYIVALDGGTYFPYRDYNIEITRACFRLEHSARGPHFRLPREAGSQLMSQTLRLQEHYQDHGGGRQIVLCDDGVGTGKTAAETVNLLEQLGLTVHKIVVFLNPNNLQQVGDVEVKTLITVEHPFIWLSERDLYWGLPRSGTSFALPYQVYPNFGIPYTIDSTMVEERIGFTPDVACAFRESALHLNQRFWELLETGHNRPLALAGCQRLRFLSEFLTDEDLRVATFIERINLPEFKLENIRRP